VTIAPPKRPPIPKAGTLDWDAARLLETARGDAASALRLCRSANEGLTQAEAEQRLATYGPNEIDAYKPEGWYVRLFHALRNPLVILLAVLAAVSLATGDVRAATVMTPARLSPTDKERIIRSLQAGGHIVGFMGDGINDAAALRAADVGISVDTAVDVAKESADIILLEKSLLVLEEGVLEGRKVFSNVLKYIRMGASSNFGNMFSVIGASALLPFVPMAPIQILTNNLLYDFSQVPIPTDNVDAEQIARPRPWDIKAIGRFIVAIGPISSIFDYTTYAVMYFVFNARTPAQAALFQTGWFVESLMTQTLIIHVIRTSGVPFLQSRASWPLVATTVCVMAIGLWLPVSPLAPALGFVALPPLYWPILAATLLSYVLLTQLVKVLLLRRQRI
jgi:Mg2+-importing ATPase